MKNASGYRHLRDQRGLVLIIVLWIVALLAVMAGGFAYSMRIETRLAASTVERAQARALAEAGVAYALAWRLNPDSEAQKQWPPNGDPHEWAFGGGRLRIQIVDASGLVNINTANLELLKALLATVGVDARDQDRLATAIYDWLHPDGLSPLLAAGFRKAGRTRSTPITPGIESIEELQQVPGMTPAIYARIASVTTVFSRNGRVTPELAPAPVLQALGLDERAITDYIAARARAFADGSIPPPLPKDSGQFFSAGVRTNVYHVWVTAEVASGTSARVEAVVDGYRANPGRLPRLLAWRDGL